MGRPRKDRKELKERTIRTRVPENLYQFIKKTQERMGYSNISQTVRQLLIVMHFNIESGLLMAPVTKNGKKVVESFMREMYGRG